MLIGNKMLMLVFGETNAVGFLFSSREVFPHLLKASIRGEKQ